MSSNTKPKLPLVAYTRVSEQGRRSDEELLSHEIQRSKIEQYLASAALSVSPERFEDTDRSGGRMSRPAFDRAIAGVLEGRYGGIAVSRLSRFARTTREALELIEQIERAGAAFVCLDPRIDTSTASGRAILTVFLAFVTLEREQAVEQAALVVEKKLAALRNGEDGCGLGGRPPVGYEFEVTGTDSNGKAIRGRLVPNGEAAVVREAFELFASTSATPGGVADFLNERGIRTSRGNRWNARNVRGFLARETYVGVRHYGEVRVEGAHEPLVGSVLWRKAQRKLRPKEGAVRRTRGEGHLLGEGLVRCGRCGSVLVKGRANGKYETLRCLERGSEHASISYRRAAAYITAAAVEHVGLLFSAIQVGGNGAELEAAEARLAQGRAELAEVEAAEEELSPLAFGRALDKARKAVEEGEDALAALDRTEAWWAKPYLLTIAGGNRLAFEALPVPEQRRFLHEQIERATLKPGRGAAEERIEIEWTHEPGPREITDKDWTVLQFSEQVGLAFENVPPDAPLSSETLEMLREQALAEFRRGGALRRGATAVRPEAASDTAAQEALEGGDRATQTERREQP
jgi:DNA invertase Pin-like site-specific DNA recombinase